MGPTSTIYKSFTTQNLKFKLQKEIIKTVYVTIYKSIKKKKKQNKEKDVWFLPWIACIYD